MWSPSARRFFQLPGWLKCVGCRGLDGHDSMHTSKLLFISALVRLGLVLYGEIQDRLAPVPYTDIDYIVFSDAARYVAAGQSPYERSTYRYTPLLAYLLLPNIWVSTVWGKLLFSSLDIAVGALTARLVTHLGGSPAQAQVAAAAWLYNPYTATISTRGSCDVLVVVLLLGTLWYLSQGAASHAAVTYGLAVHLRIYPIIFAPSIVLFLAARSLQRHTKRSNTQQPDSPPARGLTLPNSMAEWNRVWLPVALHGIIFGSLSGSVFFSLLWLFNKLYGQTFLNEAFLHHLGRKDPRHNFSMYFYTIYLTYFNNDTTATGSLSAAAATDQAQFELAAGLDPSGPSGPALDPMSQLFATLGSRLAGVCHPAALAFIPQMLLLLVLAFKLHADLPLCWLLQTIVFVALNKVSTAQYFVWWFSLLPLVLHDIPRPVPRLLLVAGACWVMAQLHWLGWAYLLEFQGLPVYLAVWAASVVFLAANVFLACQLLLCVKPSRSFLACSLSAAPQPPPQLKKSQ